MKKIAKFEKVSFEQFYNDFKEIIQEEDWNNKKEFDDKTIKEIYDNLKIPKRATTGSAGYDFFIPVHMVLYSNQYAVIPTGIRCKIEDGWVLKLYPRSGLGFRNKLYLYNTVGIIDSDYYNSDNEGHIIAKVAAGHETHINMGKAFIQGVFVPYGITVDDDAQDTRNGGFGSTSK